LPLPPFWVTKAMTSTGGSRPTTIVLHA
jgi:hypothetical protein